MTSSSNPRNEASVLHRSADGGLVLGGTARADDAVDWHKSALHSKAPDGEVLHLTIGAGASPNVIERWWNGKRVRWLDEGGSMKPDDLRVDVVAIIGKIPPSER